MSKALKPGDIEKLQKRLCRVSSLRNSVHMLREGSQVWVTLVDMVGCRESFCVSDMSSKGEIARCAERLLKEEKDAIRKKYDIDIK